MKDCRRDFILAGWEYYKVSNIDLSKIKDPPSKEVIMDLFLKPAITCAILSPAGDKKYHLMS